MPVIEVISKQQTRRYPFEGKRFVFGRIDTCDAVLTNDNLISREHCEIVLHKGSYVLHDLKSRNGTKVLGKNIDVVKLIDAGVFQVGHTYVRFFATAETAEAAAPGRYPTGKTNGQVATPTAAAPVEDDDDEPIYDVGEIVVDEPVARGPAAVQREGVGAELETIDSMAFIGFDPGFGIEALSLLNSRGQVVHAAGAELTSETESLEHLQLLTLGSLRCNASDIHLEPKQYDALVRVRVDGAMLEVCHLTAEQNKRLMSLIKVLCDIDITRKSIIQEGHFSLNVPGRQIDYRVSFAPAMYGQKMVVRVLDPAQSPQQLSDLDMPEEILERLRSTSEQSTGTVLVCGPTGSGKTTTLYAVLRQVDSASRNVITIEDPIEYELDGVTQIPVDSKEGHTFGNLLRTCLRQDPDVIVLGEIRDQDTGVTAMQAATTGHLVLSTVHANDTVSTVLRLLDLGVEPYLIASTLNLVLAQRLVRRLCKQCKKPAELSESDRKKLHLEEGEPHGVFAPVGCKACFKTGYAGRVGIFELLNTNDAFRDVILSKPNLIELKNALKGTDFKSLQQHARERVLSGVASIEDAHRTVGLD